MSCRLSSDEIQDLLAGCPCSVLFCGTDFKDKVDLIDLKKSGVRAIVWVGQWGDSVEKQLDAEMALQAESVENLCYGKISVPTAEMQPFVPIPLPKDDGMHGVQLFFTSGTTGKPKQIVHSASNIYQWSAFSINALGLDANDHHCALHSMTMSHIADNAFVWSLTFIGGRHAFMTCSLGDVAGFLQTLSDEQVTIAKAAPTLISIACGFSSKTFSKYDLSSIDWIWSAGAALSDDLRSKAEEKFGCDIWIGYGMTETTGPVSCSKGGAKGYKVLDGVHVRIVKEDNTVAGVLERGEIQIKGPTVFRGYSGVSDDVNAAAFNDGWLKSGDAGMIDENGMLHITGRIKDMIIVAGENVFAAEVESVIATLESVKLVAVVGKPDKTLGEVVEAAVIIRDGHKVTEEEIIDICKEKLADFKVPKKVHFLTEVPLTSSGKVQKDQLKFLLYNQQPEPMEHSKEPAEAKNLDGGVVALLQKTILDNFGLQIDPEKELFESGMTSLQAIELLGIVEKVLDCELPGALLFECPTLLQIADFLHEEGIIKTDSPQEVPGLAKRMTKRITRAFTTLTNSVLLLRTSHHKAAEEYVSVEQDFDYDANFDDTHVKPRDQNNPLVLILQFFLYVITRPIICTVGFSPLILCFTYLYEEWHVGYLFLISAPVLLASSFLMVIALAVLKWILLGKIRPGIYPLWGFYYCRWLAIHNAQRWTFRFLGIYRSTPFYTFFFRLMGTKIGSNAIIDTCWIMDNDLVKIGDNAYIARDVNIQPSYVQNGVLILKPIVIGSHAVLRHGACILGGANVPDKATVGYLQTVSSPIVRREFDKDQLEPGVPAEVKTLRTHYNSLTYVLLQVIGMFYIAYIIAASVLVAGEMMYQVFTAVQNSRGLPPPDDVTVLVDGEYFWPFFYMALTLPISLWVIIPWAYCFCIALTKWILIGQLPAMVMLTEKPLIMDLWKRWLLIRLTDFWFYQVLLAITTMSELSCSIYRLMGSRIGKRVYFNAPYIGADFDLLEVGNDCMVAWDVSLLPNCFTGVSRPVVLKDGACVANNLVLCDGVQVGENSLVGDLVNGPSGHNFSKGTIWTGKGRPICVGKTQTPPPKTSSAKYWAYEILLCSMQIILPPIMNTPGVIALIYTKRGIDTVMDPEYGETETMLILFLGLLPLLIVIMMICKLSMMIIAKWLLLGRFQPGPTEKFTSWKYVRWVALDSIIFEMEMAWLNDIRGTAFACVRAILCSVLYNGLALMV